MTKQPSPDLLDLAEAVAAGTLRADDAERQLRLALASDRAAETEQALRELRGLIGGASAVRAHARATREAFGSASQDLAATVAPTPASIATLVPGRVTAGAVHSRSSNGDGGAGRAPRRTWLLAAAALLLVGGAMAAGSGLVRLPSVVPPVPAPTLPVAVTNPTVAPAAPTATPAPTDAGLPAQPGQFDDMCDFGLGSTTVGWVSTSTALYRTEDLGKTWSAVQPPGWSAATAVANLFIDADTAYSFLQGSPSKIAATHDGGATWVETVMGTAGAWPAFSFQTPSSGSLIFYGQFKTDPVHIYATADGGLTWGKPRSATTVWGAIMPDWCVHREPSGTLAQTHPWLDSKPLNGFVQLSRDAGLTWTKRPIPAGNYPDLWGDESGRMVLAVHPEGPPPVDDRIYTSGDDGRSWHWRRTA